MPQMYCSKCRKTMADTNFYTYRDGTKCELCKSCLTMHMNAFDKDSFIWALEKFDVPYIESAWNDVRDKEYQKALDKVTAGGSKHPKEDAYSLFNNGVVFGKYLGKMKLNQWNKYRWADTEKIKQEQEEQAKLHGRQPDAEAEAAAIKEAYEKGEISEAQYMTYTFTQEQEAPSFEMVDGAVVSKKPGSSDIYPVNESPFEKVDIPDVAADLTEEDKICLAMKWGQLYSAADWVYLDEKYDDFKHAFGIQDGDAGRLDTLVHICKLSLKMNQAIDTGDMDSYSKLYRAYDSLMKSAKFTEAQNKEDKVGDFDSIGEIVLLCEKEKGHIDRPKLEYDQDVVDTVIKELKAYNYNLITSDTAVFKQIEEYIKKREILAEQQADEQFALEAGDEKVQISDQDLQNYRDSIDEQIEEDNTDEPSGT